MFKKAFLCALSLALLCLAPMPALADGGLPSWEEYVPPPPPPPNIAILRESVEDSAILPCDEKGEEHSYETYTASRHILYSAYLRYGEWQVAVEYCTKCGDVARDDAAFVEGASPYRGGPIIRRATPSAAAEAPRPIAYCIAEGEEHNFVTSTRATHVFYLDEDVCGLRENARTYCPKCGIYDPDRGSAAYTEHTAYHKDCEN